jgi:N-acetylglucosaminyl-diphospho-decaprenol L-rhamnosyltransferase
MLITAIIVTHQSEAVIAACVSALLAQGVIVIVVDNASRDATIERAREAGAQILSLPRNIGFGAACNLGAERAQSQWLLFINPDAVVQEDAIAHFKTAIESYPDAGIMSPRIMEPNGRLFSPPRSILATFLTGVPNQTFELSGDCCTPAVSGACMMVRADLFGDLGGFDRDIFLFYEDDDLCRRAADRGSPIIYVHQCIVLHLRGQSSAPSLKTVFLMRACQAWSRGYISAKYALKYRPMPTLMINGLKLIFAAVTFNTRRVARYAGSLVGTVRALMHWPSPR